MKNGGNYYQSVYCVHTTGLVQTAGICMISIIIILENLRKYERGEIIMKVYMPAVDEYQQEVTPSGD